MCCASHVVIFTIKVEDRNSAKSDIFFKETSRHSNFRAYVVNVQRNVL